MPRFYIPPFGALVSSGAPDGSLDRLDSPLQVLISLLLQGSRDSVCTCQQSVFNVTTLPLRICSLIRLSLSLCLSVCPCVYFSAYVCFSNLDLRCRRRVARAVLSLSRVFVTAATAAAAASAAAAAAADDDAVYAVVCWFSHAR